MITLSAPLVALLISALTSETAFVIWVWRTTLSRDDARIKTLEGNQLTTLQTLVNFVTPLADVIRAQTEAFRDLRLTILQNRSGR